MATRIIEIVNNSQNKTPEYAHSNDAGMDIRADFSHPDVIKGDKCAWDEERHTFIIFSGGRACIPTGLYTAIPAGYEIQIRPRSGLALKQGISVLNTPGTLDATYRGEIGVILINLSDEPFEIQQGDRIAQMILNKVETIKWQEVNELDTTDRGEGGFGSSGIK